METIAFDKLLLKTAFCCAASNGTIDPQEVTKIKELCENSEIFIDFNFQEEINILIQKINTRGKEFITYYFDLLKNSNLTEQQEVALIDFAIKTIKSDGITDYSEIKFFKNIRHRLTISDENILAVFPDIEDFLEKDILTESFLDRITNQYLEAAELPQFEFIEINNTSLTENNNNDQNN